MALENEDYGVAELDSRHWDSSLSQTWTCTACTFLNELYSTHCEVCAAPRNFASRDRPSRPRLRFDPDDSDDGDDFAGINPSDVDGVALENGIVEYNPDVNSRGFFHYAISGAITGMFAIGGAFTGAFAGAIAGRITESGIVRGAGLGALAGAVLSLEALEAIRRLIRRENLAELQTAFMTQLEMMAAAQTNRLNENLSYEQLLQIFGYGHMAPSGLTSSALSKLPKHTIVLSPSSSSPAPPSEELITCSICLMDLCNGQEARSLPVCNHTFHLHCADLWLVRHAQCPMCRRNVSVS